MAEDAEHPQEPAALKDLGRTIRLIALAVLVAITVALVLDNLSVGWPGAHHRQH